LACVDVTAEIWYCRGLVTYAVADDFNATVADTAAFTAYQADLALWRNDTGVECSNQVPGSTLCSNCLAVRRAYHCASQFPRCVDDAGNSRRGLCRRLCDDANDRCATSEDCGVYPSSDCASAPRRAAAASTALLLLLFGATLLLY
jgi:hypothetical protein